MRWFLSLAVSAAIVGGSLPAEAASKAADRIVRKHIADACGGGAATMEPAAVIERDLTGDGKADLIVDQGLISCKDGMNGFCGTAGCAIDVYVRQGDRFVEKLNLLGFGIEILDGNPPRLRMSDRDGGRHIYRWKGGQFR